ncbi:hypothetical protein [Tropicibacter naphthalenivorans]|uniref:Uncharacterized protein n=1 Tax=Tropicibacter naphthalenivorans TaxID=441103 RepID=A0A0P1GAY4_9RHOB|nr:hypothetical protein [Tropicibacter naphthalenivorans]CUH78671.1 hypothetical protein TRN7648_02103 [Tropicibacter naphthalenivorans]SMC81185.1 hypothetical protein SAMN04488093_104265 [Tropicibacter naphthalenivorans]
MKLPLDHPAWGALFGPYGVQDVPGVLRALSAEWHTDLARDLFWEKLHHQETLYPVTWAALPWLLEMPARREVLEFASWVLYCAGYALHAGDGMALVLAEACCGGNSAPADTLRTQYGAEMAALADWARKTAPLIAEDCITEAQTHENCGYLLVGPAALAKASELAIALQGAPLYETEVICLDCGQAHYGFPGADGYTFEAIPEDTPTGPAAQADQQRAFARTLADRLDGQPSIAAYLRRWAGFSCCAKA